MSVDLARIGSAVERRGEETAKTLAAVGSAVERRGQETAKTLAAVGSAVERRGQEVRELLEFGQERTQSSLAELKKLSIANFESLVKNGICHRWQVLDALDGILFPPETPVRCLVCGHVAARRTYETKSTQCIFGGGHLERYVCPECGAIFGPLKIMALGQDQLGEEYRQSYSVYSESDCTMLEKLAFEALHARKDGVYLNYGAGAWNKTTKELRDAGYEVYDYEPYAPASAAPWVIKKYEDLCQRKFDGIFSNDVIEHFRDPIRELQGMSSLLNPNGEMVHCSGCYEYAFEYTRFHLVFFTGNSLRHVADAIGMQYELGERQFDYSPARLCRFSAK